MRVGGQGAGQASVRVEPSCPYNVCARALISERERERGKEGSDDINTMSFTTLQSAQIAEW